MRVFFPSYISGLLSPGRGEEGRGEHGITRETAPHAEEDRGPSRTSYALHARDTNLIQVALAALSCVDRVLATARCRNVPLFFCPRYILLAVATRAGAVLPCVLVSRLLKQLEYCCCVYRYRLLQSFCLLCSCFVVS